MSDPDPELSGTDDTSSSVASGHSKASFEIRAAHEEEKTPVPIGEVVSFENENFKGRMLVRIKEDERFASYFASKKRLCSVVVTGKFKNKTAVQDLMTGQEFEQPLDASPGWFLVNAAIQAFK
jgi:hypothetical protein